MLDIYSKEHVENLKSVLEPETPLGIPYASGAQTISVDVSIAISLKRIADTLTVTGPGGDYSVHDFIQHIMFKENTRG